MILIVCCLVFVLYTVVWDFSQLSLQYSESIQPNPIQRSDSFMFSSVYLSINSQDKFKVF